MRGAAWADVARAKVKANSRAGINDLHMSLPRLTAIFLRPHFIVGERPSSTVADAKECRIADRWRCSYNFVSINRSMTSGSPIMHSFWSHPGAGGQVVGDLQGVSDPAEARELQPGAGNGADDV